MKQRRQTKLTNTVKKRKKNRKRKGEYKIKVKEKYIRKGLYALKNIYNRKRAIRRHTKKYLKSKFSKIRRKKNRIAKVQLRGKNI